MLHTITHLFPWRMGGCLSAACLFLIGILVATPLRSEVLPAKYAEGILLDTGADRTSVTKVPFGSISKGHVIVISAGGREKRPLYDMEITIGSCTKVIRVSKRKPKKGLADTLIGRDMLSACNILVRS